MNENASDALPESGGNPSAENSKNIDIPEWFEKMKSSEEGLSAAEAESRLAEYGPNALEETHVSLFRVMLSYFWGPIPG